MISVTHEGQHTKARKLSDEKQRRIDVMEPGGVPKLRGSKMTRIKVPLEKTMLRIFGAGSGARLIGEPVEVQNGIGKEALRLSKIQNGWRKKSH